MLYTYCVVYVSALCSNDNAMSTVHCDELVDVGYNFLCICALLIAVHFN